MAEIVTLYLVHKCCCLYLFPAHILVLLANKGEAHLNDSLNYHENHVFICNSRVLQIKELLIMDHKKFVLCKAGCILLPFATC